MPTCPACGSPMSRVRVAARDYQIVECPNCRLAKTEPASFVSQASYEDAPGVSEKFTAADPRMARYARDFLGYLRPFATSGRLLDVGCSAGALVEAANAAGYATEGIDLDARAVAAGQSRDIPVHCRSLEDWPGRDYDAVALKHVVEHLAEPVGFLRACAARLRPGGVLLIAVPGHTGLVPSLFPKWWYGWQPSQHYFHYSRESMRRTALAAGLTPLRIWHTTMDHWVSLAGWKTVVKSALTTGAANVGHHIGRGDQLIAALRNG